MAHLLDNPTWAALNTGNKSLAVGTEQVKYYPADISPFVGLQLNSEENLRTLYEITPYTEDVYGVHGVETIAIPEPWKLLRHVKLKQMVYEQPSERKAISVEIADLSYEHVPQMIALTALTQPGPFKERTIELGHYQDIFHGDQLVAMAGQRMYATPFAEVSAVCTHPDFLGRGYAAQLIMNQVERISQAGETAFLHVAKSNERAIKLYEKLGFVTRVETNIYFIRK